MYIMPPYVVLTFKQSLFYQGIAVTSVVSFSSQLCLQRLLFQTRKHGTRFIYFTLMQLVMILPDLLSCQVEAGFMNPLHAYED